MPIQFAIGHIDADCFYVSAERVRDSFLLGKLVGVTSIASNPVMADSFCPTSIVGFSDSAPEFTTVAAGIAPG